MDVVLKEKPCSLQPRALFVPVHQELSAGPIKKKKTMLITVCKDEYLKKKEYFKTNPTIRFNGSD